MGFSKLMIEWKEVLGDLYEPVLAGAKVIGIIVAVALFVRVGSFVIKKVFQKQKNFKYGINSKRLDTMATLLISVFRYLCYIIAAVVILSDVFKLTSVLTAAGIGAVAIGLGAQSLIKDFISGFFIIVEDQFVVGDLITVDNMTGTVEEMELRVTKLRNFNGDLHIIPNGEIKRITNHTRGNKAVQVDIPLDYSTDTLKAMELAGKVCEAVAGEFTTIVEQPKVLGITDLGKEGINLRIVAKTLPNEQWEVERRLRLKIKEEFSRNGIGFIERNKINLTP